MENTNSFKTYKKRKKNPKKNNAGIFNTLKYPEKVRSYYSYQPW